MRAPEPFTRDDGSTSYRIRFRFGVSSKNGGAKYTSETFPSLEEAERFARLLEDLGPAAALKQIYAEDDDATIPTLDEYAAQHIRSLTRITDGTRTSYERIVRRTWSKKLGLRQLNHIDRHDVAAVVNWLVAEGKSDKTIANAHGLLAAIMKGAVVDGHIGRSPCDGIRLPRSSEHTDTEHRYLTHAEYQVLRAATGDHFRPLVDTLAGTGIRWGEAEALQVKDIDFSTGIIRISRAAKWDSSKAVREIGPTKTRLSRRTITLPPCPG